MSSGSLVADEVHRARLGTPYIQYDVDTLRLAKPSYEQGNFKDLLVGGTNINFPIFVDNVPRSTISVGYSEGTWRPYAAGGNPERIIQVQQLLADQGITERLDILTLIVGPDISAIDFGMLEHQGRTWLIPLRDPEQRLAELDFSGRRMYAVDEVLPLLHDLASKVVDQLHMRECIYKQRPTAPSFPTPVPTNTTDALLLSTPTIIPLSDLAFTSRKFPKPPYYAFDELARFTAL